MQSSFGYDTLLDADAHPSNERFQIWAIIIFGHIYEQNMPKQTKMEMTNRKTGRKNYLNVL